MNSRPMSNIDKRALREAAEKAIVAHERLSVMPPDDIFDISLAEGTQLDADITALNALNSAANPTTVLALLDEVGAMHKYAKDRDAENEGLMITAGRLRVEKEAAEKRIAELEAREVNLPRFSVGEVMHMSGFSRDYAEGWCSGNDNAIHEIHAAGVKVAAAAGKGEAS